MVWQNTLLKIILGNSSTEGTVKSGQLTAFNYVDQAAPTERRRTVSKKSAMHEFVFLERNRFLAAYRSGSFSPKSALSTGSKISAAARSRLLAARSSKTREFIILDEPTNI